ncbi:MAG: sugar transporter [Acidimicrobiia bacterium]|nr:sugar transporter [Acidimicrobiia bacterium]
MTAEQARRQAEALGIDLSNPVQAAQRARELGVPESTIQRLLRAVQEQEAADEPDTANVVLPPILADTLAVLPDTSLQAERRLALARAAAEAQIETPLEEFAAARQLPYFGYNVFQNVPDAFQPSAVGPVDDGYIVGPGDELRLSVWGAAEFQYDLAVDREGRVFVPNVGQITVAGRRLEALRNDVRLSLSRSYAGLTSNPPSVSMDLTLTRLRPVQVFVLGEVARPGGYTVSSYSTAFNILYSVGGPLTSGSLRSVQVIRGGRVVSTVDIYNYLLKGYDSNPVRLQSNDFVFIPPRQITVAIEGAVYRPAIYELAEGEGMADLVRYAGGLLPDAYTKRFQIDRIIPFDRRIDPSIAREVLDYSLESVISGASEVPLRDGDKVTLSSIVDLVDNAVSVSGEVYQPGRYEIGDRIRTVRDLVREADGVTGMAHLEKANLVRVRDDSTEVLISVNLARAIEGDPAHDVYLRARDSLVVFSTKRLEAPRRVSIGGQIRAPGRYTLRDSMTVYDLLFAGGGLLDQEWLKDVYLERADLFRKLPDGKTEEIIPFNLTDALRQQSGGRMLLQPEDSIQVYPLTVEVIEDRFVHVNGAVYKPGRYRFTDNMSVEDLIIQAGGLTEAAYRDFVEVARAMRYTASGEHEVVTHRVKLSGQGPEQGIDFRLGTNGTSSEARGFKLEHRDRVFVRVDPNFRSLETVSITGEVRFPGTYALVSEDEKLSSLIQRAGGILPTGYAKGGRYYRDDEQLITEVDEVVKGKEKADVILRPGDEVFIPPAPNAVSVVGNVVTEGLIKYERGRRLSYYLDRAGGTKEDTEDIILTQASGATFKVRRGLIPANPVVDDGAIIRVTQKPPKEEGERADVGKVFTESLAILSSTLTVIVLALRAFN